MTTKRIVILANSVKHDPGRCLAGREVLAGRAGTRTGDWIRPVSTEGEGELYAPHLVVKGSGTLNTLEIVDVELKRKLADPLQPENWLIDERVPWQRVDQWPHDGMSQLLENPPHLWQEPHGRSDRVSEEYLRRHPPAQSLYWIDVRSGTFMRDSRGKARLGFQYGVIEYNLAVTDPVATNRLRSGRGSEASMQIDHATACASLAPAFKGYHYKLIATLFW